MKSARGARFTRGPSQSVIDKVQCLPMACALPQKEGLRHIPAGSYCIRVSQLSVGTEGSAMTGMDELPACGTPATS